MSGERVRIASRNPLAFERLDPGARHHVALSIRELQLTHLGLCAITLRAPMTADAAAIESAKAAVLDVLVEARMRGGWMAAVPTAVEKSSQGARCGCGGHDDMCVCQNMVWRAAL